MNLIQPGPKAYNQSEPDVLLRKTPSSFANWFILRYHAVCNLSFCVRSWDVSKWYHRHSLLCTSIDTLQRMRWQNLLLLICMTSYHAIFEFLMTHVGKKVKIIEIKHKAQNCKHCRLLCIHHLFLFEAIVFAFLGSHKS